MELLRKGAASLGIALSGRQVEQFQVYYEELAEWNQRVNLTSITDYNEVQIKHFLDSLTVVLAFKERSPEPWQGTIIDVGTGAGLPGLPLKIAFPRIHLTLLESTGKKTIFLQHVVQRLGLDGAQIVTGRAEEIAQKPEYRERYPVVLSRAVAKLPALAELTLPFCSPGGIVVEMKKGDIGAEVESAGAAIGAMGGAVRGIIRIDLPELADDRVLVVIDKTGPTPEIYPRRSGMPVKKPILS